jgi:hypothetical protein
LVKYAPPREPSLTFFIHKMKRVSIPNYLNLFDDRPVNNTLDQGYFVRYKSLAPPTFNGPLDFYINAQTDNYMSLKDSLLSVTVKVTKKDGSAIDEYGDGNEKVVSCVNNALSSLFSDCLVSVNNTLISQYSGLYPTKAYLGNYLNYNGEFKRDSLQTEGFIREFTDGTSTITGGGGMIRSKYFEASKEHTFVGRIQSELFEQNKPLPVGCSLSVKMIPSSDKFFLMSPVEDLKVNITDASLLVRHMKIDSEIILSHLEILKTKNFKLPIVKTTIKQQIIPAQTMQISIPNIFLNHLPTRLFICFIEQENLNGSLANSPHTLQNHLLTDYNVSVAGQNYPTQKLKFDMASKESAELYKYVLNACGLVDNKSCEWAMSDFNGDFFILAENFGADSNSTNIVHPPRCILFCT